MNIALSKIKCSGSVRRQGFTLIEIALALAVIAFALVAIIGVLPMGLNVQKDNREESIINSDASYWREAILNGAKGFHTISNFIDWDSVVVVAEQPYQAFRNVSNPTLSNLVGVLTLPKYQRYGRTYVRQVELVSRAMTGAIADQLNPDFAFRYHLTCELVPYDGYAGPNVNFRDVPAHLEPEYRPYEQQQRYERFIQARQLATNLYELKLTFRWPVLPGGKIGKGEQTFRTIVAGQLIDPGDIRNPQRFVSPATFVYARTNL
jgi:prepilin-type N-terminal cleavage/methylation domain-containing protein